MKNRKYSWHLVMWSVYIVYQFVEFNEYEAIDLQSVMLTISYVTVAILSFYVFYFLAWKRFLNDANWLALGASIGLGILCYVGVRYLVDEILFEVIFGFGNYSDDRIIPYFFDNIWRAGFYGVFSLIIFLLERRRDMESTMMSLKNEKIEAEMAFLRGQLNPHFLFNTLSFLHTKTLKLDPELSDTILKLSDMLRYSMQSSKTGPVPIEQEVELLENYTAIFRNRFEGKFFVDFDIAQPIKPHVIEPLLLIPFVENMFKHGVMNDADNPGRVSLKYEGDQLIFYCRNKVNTYQKDHGTGIGLENVRRRLQITYPNTHMLDVVEGNGIFSTNLKLKIG